MKNQRKIIVNPFSVAASRLSSGERLELPSNTIKDKTHLVFTARLDSLEGGRLIVGHGYDHPNGGWIEITKTEVSAFNFYSFKDPKKWPIAEKTQHGLDVSGFITVVIDKDFKRGDYALIISSTGLFRYNIQGTSGYDGSPLAFAENVTLTDCSLSFTSEAYALPIWIYGDSYLNQQEVDRWPYYLYEDDYTDVLLSAYPGEGAQRAIEDFELALTKGAPEFALWLLGMNNGDGESTEPDPTWLAATEHFLELCKEKGITPILSTIPVTPKINNAPKNEWVRRSGYRYIDFNRAVGADRDPKWYPEMLHTDDVHPAPLGAQALYARVLTDFPEIMRR